MKKLMIICISLLTLNAMYGQKNELLAERTKNTETIDWKSKMLDLGTLETGKKIEASFEFVNNTSEPVVLTNVKPSCGCTGVEYRKEAINPGEKAEISVSYTPKKAGVFQKSITVSTSVDSNPIVLKFKGTAI